MAGANYFLPSLYINPPIAPSLGGWLVRIFFSAGNSYVSAMLSQITTLSPRQLPFSATPLNILH